MKIRHDPDLHFEVVCPACPADHGDVWYFGTDQDGAEKFAFGHEHAVAVRKIYTWVWAESRGGFASKQDYDEGRAADVLAQEAINRGDQ